MPYETDFVILDSDQLSVQQMFDPDWDWFRFPRKLDAHWSRLSISKSESADW